MLVVDDSSLTCTLLKKLLIDSGYAVETAGSGAAALRCLERAPVDLILLDHWLPDCTGVELCRLLRARESEVYVPIIMVTAATDEEQRRAGFAAGVDDYVTKPFAPSDLRDRVGAWMQAHLRLRVSHERLRREHLALQQREEQCRQLIDAQNSLLQELQHRVRNNLQLISSILELQEVDGADAQSLQIIRTTRHHVRAMALVHETLHQEGGVAVVAMHDYVEKFTAGWLGTQRDAPRGVRIDVTAEPVYLPVERAMVCGLLVNELLHEGCRHPRGNGEYTLRVELGTAADGEAVLSLRAPAWESDGAASLGKLVERELIVALLLDLGARLDDTRFHAGEIRIEFSREEQGTWLPYR